MVAGAVWYDDQYSGIGIFIVGLFLVILAELVHSHGGEYELRRRPVRWIHDDLYDGISLAQSSCIRRACGQSPEAVESERRGRTLCLRIDLNLFYAIL